MFKLLLSQFIKQNGRNPNNLEMILLKQKAANQAVDQRKVVSMFDRSAVNPNKPILGGKNIPETEDDIKRRLMDQNKKGIASMKKKLEDPEERAMGGRIGYKSGTDFLEDELNKLRTQKGVEEDPLTSTSINSFSSIPDLNNPDVLNQIAIDTGMPMQKEGLYGFRKDVATPETTSIIKDIQNYKRNPDPDMRFTAPEISDFMGVDGIFKGLNPEQVQSIYDKVEKDSDEYDFSDIEGQTAFLDPFTVVGGLIKIGKGAKASVLAKEFLKNKAKQKVGKTIFDKVQKKITPPKYPQGPSNIKTGGGGGRDIGGNRNVGGGNTARNSKGQTASQATKAGTGTSQGYSQHFATGGRIGYKIGAGKKGVQALLDLVRDKFGKKAVTTGDKAPIPPKTLERDMFKAADKRLSDKREMTEDEIYDFAEEIGGELDAYDFDGTVGSAKRILKEHKEYMDDMYRQYRMGKLDPEPGDKSEARKIFLQNKLDEMEATGDKKLMTVDEIEELSNFDLQSEMDVAKSLAPKMTERLELKQKYPGITDDLLDKILIDDNVQRKAEVLATIDEAFKMMEKGKSSDEILDTMKNVTRTKQADGGIMRANFVGGGMGRRGFLKMLGGVGAGIGALKTGILGFGGKGATKEVAKEVVKQSAGTPPPYFFKLAEKIKKMGDDVTATTDRTISKSLKSKDGKSEFILEEDVATGDTIIKKVNKEGDDMINDIEIMEFRKGEVVEGPGGKPVKTPDEYDEVTESISRIYKDNFNDPDYSEGIRVKEVMEEVMDAPSIKKASGGIARMLGE